MRRKLAIIGILILASSPLAACSNTVKMEDRGDGSCLQTREQNLFGATLFSDQYITNCGPE